MRSMSLCMCAFLLLAGCTGDKVGKGNICLRLGDYQMAVGFFREVLRRSPDNFEARLGLGKALLQAAVDRSDQSVWREAVVQLEAARSIQPSGDHLKLLSTVWLERGRMLLRGGDTLDALEALTRAIEYDPRSVEPLNTAGIVYFRMGENAKSSAIFARALQLDSTDASANFNSGMVRWSAGDAAEAHRFWLRALKSAPADPDILYWFAAAEKTLRESGAAPGMASHAPNH